MCLSVPDEIRLSARRKGHEKGVHDITFTRASASSFTCCALQKRSPRLHHIMTMYGRCRTRTVKVCHCLCAPSHPLPPPPPPSFTATAAAAVPLSSVPVEKVIWPTANKTTQITLRAAQRHRESEREIKSERGRQTAYCSATGGANVCAK